MQELYQELRMSHKNIQEELCIFLQMPLLPQSLGYFSFIC